MPELSVKRMADKIRGIRKSSEHRQRMRASAKRYWANAPSTDDRREKLIKRNKTKDARAKSAAAQNRRWTKHKELHPPTPKVLLSKEERGRRVSERQTGKKHAKPYKSKGIKQGPRQTSYTCLSCNRTMKFYNKRHKCPRN